MGFVKTAQASHAGMFHRSVPIYGCTYTFAANKTRRKWQRTSFATQMTTSWNIVELMHQSCSKVVICRDDDARWVIDVHRIRQQRTVKCVTLDVVAGGIVNFASGPSLGCRRLLLISVQKESFAYDSAIWTQIHSTCVEIIALSPSSAQHKQMSSPSLSTQGDDPFHFILRIIIRTSRKRVRKTIILAGLVKIP